MSDWILMSGKVLTYSRNNKATKLEVAEEWKRVLPVFLEWPLHESHDLQT